MDGSIRGGRDNLNCQCQCHFPADVRCQITCCCHCLRSFSPQFENNTRNVQRVPDNFPSPNYFNRNYEENNLKNRNEVFNPMSSYSTNFKSIDDSYIDKNKPNYYSLRKRQEQEQRQRLNTDNNLCYTFNNNLNNDNNTYNPNYANTFPCANMNNQVHGQIITSMDIDPNKQKPYNNIPNNYNEYQGNDMNNNSLMNSNDVSNKITENNNINNIVEQQQSPLEDSQISPSHIHVDIPGMQEDLIKCRELISSLKKENNSLKNQRDSALNQFASNQNTSNVDRLKLDELEKENLDLRNRLSDAYKQNKQHENYIVELKNTLQDLDKIIHDKDKEIQNNLLKMRQMEQDYNNQINELKNRIDNLNREKEAMYRDFINQMNILKDEIKNLKNMLAEEQMKIKDLEDKLKAKRLFDEKREKLLETLFNWFNRMNRLLNTNTASGITPPKEILNDVLNLQTPEEFNEKLNQIEDKLKQFIEDMKLKFGQCFACDIACCTSEVDRLKYFRHYYPGPPKDYLERKKSKSKSKPKI